MKGVLAVLLAVSLATIGLADPPHHFKVFMWKANMKSTTSNPLQLKAVDRDGGGEGDPRGEAMESLLAGPSSGEKHQGFRDMDTDGLVYNGIKTHGTHLTVNFKSNGHHHWSGDLSASRFKQAVIRTIKRFPEVTQVSVAIDGDTQFDHG